MVGSEQGADGGPPETVQPHDVFLSYSRVDKPHAREVLELLEAQGFSVWWDDMLEGGVRFHQVTEHSLENAAVVVVLWSETSVKSHWVHDEATRGRDRGVLVSVSIDGTPPPLGFRQFQWIDISGEGQLSLKPEASKLTRAIERMRSGEDASQPAPAIPLDVGRQKAGKAPAPALTRRLMLAGGGAALAGVAGLAAWQGGVFGGMGGLRRLAVLPFDLKQEDTINANLLAGIADEIRTQLARNPLLLVTARTSSMAVEVAGKTASEICKELKVDFLLTGGVTSDARRIAVKAELVEGRNDLTVLPIDEASPTSGVLALQKQIASQVVRELTSEDGNEDKTRSGGTDDIAAYNAFLEGVELYLSGLSEETDRAALVKFEEAIRIDPAYASAHAMRGQTLALVANLYAEPSQIGPMYDEAISYAQEATRIAPQFPLGFSVIGDILANRKLDIAAAREPFEMAAKLGNGDAAIVSRYALFKGRIGEFGAAREAIAGAMALDPLNAGVLRFAGNIEYDSRNYAAALRFFKDAQAVREQMNYAPYLIGLAQLELGDNEAAKAAFEQTTRLVWRETGLAIVHHRMGDQAEARRHFDILQEAQGEKSNYQYMQVYAQWGELDAALDAMDKAWAVRDSGLVQFRNDPLLDPIRSSPRAQAVLSQMGVV